MCDSQMLTQSCAKTAGKPRDVVDEPTGRNEMEVDEKEVICTPFDCRYSASLEGQDQVKRMTLSS